VRFRFEVVVRLKDGLLDPQGKAILDSLPHLGWTNVSSVRVGKHIELALEAYDAASAKAQAEEMAQRLLANPVIEEVAVHLVENVAAEPMGRGVAR
jgi:phosphoribosylformylglycinamidine synthase subunit PurS